MANKYLVALTAAAQAERCHLIKQGKPSARKVARAHMLLHAAEGATDAEIAATVRIGLSTGHRTRQRFVEAGLANALTERRRPGTRQKLDGTQEACLVALACSTPPPGRKRWTMQVLADRLVALQLVEAVSDETVRRVLKNGSVVRRRHL
jgi:transposase